ncbi:MAG: hypothetical protein KC431_08175, partial [Myxococcales bacterium]|nr:hypothetical protein [Myxococcales bacterium]
QCDDGNTDDGDACTNLCNVAGCGDGSVWVGVEGCDDGNADNTDMCTTLCEAPSCDDGLISGDELDVDCGGSSCGSCYGLSQHTWKGTTKAGLEWTQIEAADYDITTRGGPLEIELSIPLVGGGDSACRPTVDGEWAGSFEGLDESFQWHEGRDRTGWNSGKGFRLWRRMRVYYDIPAGEHTLGVQCRTSMSEVDVGRVESSSVILTREYDQLTSKVHQRISLMSTTMAASATMVKLPGTELTRDVGGTIEVAISVPIGEGGHAACLPWMDNAPIPSSVQVYSGAFWSAGLASTYGSWNLWTHSRAYEGIEPGTHTFDIRCHSDANVLKIGEDGAASVLIVREIDNDDQVVAQGVDLHDNGWEIDGNSAMPFNWYPLQHHQATVEVTHGTLDVAAFTTYYQVNGGAWLSCRPMLNGMWLGTYSGAAFESNEEEGVIHQLASDGYHGVWYRRRLYTGIPEGPQTIEFECVSNSDSYWVGRYGQGTLTVRDVPLINGG